MLTPEEGKIHDEIFLSRDLATLEDKNQVGDLVLGQKIMQKTIRLVS